MTRINLIDPHHLTKTHLIAEYKEITQFVHLVKKRIDKNCKFDDIPDRFTLNTGHCKFFYNKGQYIHSRIIQLYHCMERRGVHVDREAYELKLERVYDSYHHKRRKDLFNYWIPNEDDYRIVINRIKERIEEKPHLYPDSTIFYDNLGYYIQ